jgi:cyclophilin family peptidyl-prolyl cis-trans isomerase
VKIFQRIHAKRSFSRTHHARRWSGKGRRTGFEQLEDRRLLSSVGLLSINNVTMEAGTTLFVPLNGSASGQTVNFAVTASDYSNLTPTVMPASDSSLQFTVLVNNVAQTMDFQLFNQLAPNTAAAIENLVNADFYNGLEIYRNGNTGNGATTLMQGGNEPPNSTFTGTSPIKTTGEPANMAEEFNPDLQFTSAGLLAMARQAAPGTSSSEFFVTGGASRGWDFNYTIFGFQTTGQTVAQTIEAMPVNPADTSGLGYMETPVEIQLATIFQDTQNGVLQLRAPADATGSVTVTVTAYDAAGDTPTTQTFTVTFTSNTGSANPFASVTPATPAQISFLPPSGSSSTSTDLNNSSAANALTFNVTGVTAGNYVEVLADGNPISQLVQVPSGDTSVAVTTNGTSTLSNGPHTFTAIQVAENQTATINESNASGGTTPESQTANVPSLNAPLSAQVTVTPLTPAVSSVTTNVSTISQADVGSGKFTVTVTYNEAMDESSTPSITFSPDASSTLDLASGGWTSSTQYVATYDVTGASVTQSGIDINVANATSTGGTTQTAYSGSNNFSIDTLDPAVTSLTPNLTTLTSSNVGNGTFTLTVVYSEAMDTGSSAPQPAISFPTAGENPVSGGTLTFSSGSWTNTTTYVATYNVADEGVTMSNIEVEVQSAVDASAAHTQVPFTQSSVFSVAMAATGSLAGVVSFGSTSIGIGGVTIRLLSNGTEVSAKSPIQTNSDGSYSFTALAPGTYTIELVPSPDYSTWNTVVTGSSPAGTTSGLPADQIQAVLASGNTGTGYDFTAKGLPAKMLSARLFFASAPSLTVSVQSMHAAPAVSLSGSSSSTGSTASFQLGGAAVAIAPSATITAAGSTTLTELTATLTDAKDGASEVLAVPSADLSGTNITSSYANGVLTLSGVADVSAYQTALEGITYNDTAASPQTASRTINVTVNDGTATSQAATATVSFSTTSATPAVTAISPTSGPAAGGSTVTVTGTGFGGATAVDFGSSAASAFTVNSATSITATSPAGSGTQDITVVTPGGTSATSSADQFTYEAAPAVTGISPTSGPTAGGTTVTISGSGFTSATAVDFGSVAAASFGVVSDSEITATSPAGSGTVDVTVISPSATSATSSADEFTYEAAPTVTGIAPSSGPAAGGTQVVITGTGFTGASVVDFGNQAASSFTLNSATQITAVSPQSTGTVDVTVTTPGGTSATSSSDKFTYAPTVTAVTPDSGPTAGSTQVTITGTGFSNATAVDFGGVAAASFGIVSSTEITATSPAGSGTVDVTVVAPAGTSATSPSDQFTYVAAPSVTGVLPDSGPAAGGTQVTITGTALTGATVVDFGGVPASSFSVSSATQIIAVSPAGTGAVDVTVTTPGGSSSPSPSDQFTYAPTVTAVSPNAGPGEGGTSVAITGTGFSNATAVDFGTTTATTFTALSDTQITAVSPAGTGQVDITVVAPAGTSATSSADQFTYAPTVAAVTPNTGAAAGNTSVVITGTGFTNVSTVKFGSAGAGSFTVNSATQITVVSPAGTGTVDVTVTTPNGTSQTSSLDQFVYNPAPADTVLAQTDNWLSA